MPKPGETEATEPPTPATAPAATADTPPVNDPSDEGDDLSTEDLAGMVKKLRAENAKHRTAARDAKKQLEEKLEAERQAQLTEAQKAEERARALEARAAALEAREREVARKQALLGAVSHPDHVLKLATDEKYWDGNTPHLDAIHEDFPMFKPEVDNRARTPGASRATSIRPAQVDPLGLIESGDLLGGLGAMAADQLKQR